MKKILMLSNLTKDNLDKLKDALLGTGLIYTVDLELQMVAIQGDNDALYRARVALTAYGFIIK